MTQYYVEGALNNRRTPVELGHVSCCHAGLYAQVAGSDAVVRICHKTQETYEGFVFDIQKNVFSSLLHAAL
jgi:hypothetical protein